jgi:hypothetical protein
LTVTKKNPEADDFCLNFYEKWPPYEKNWRLIKTDRKVKTRKPTKKNDCDNKKNEGQSYGQFFY